MTDPSGSLKANIVQRLEADNVLGKFQALKFKNLDWATISGNEIAQTFPF